MNPRQPSVAGQVGAELRLLQSRAAMARWLDQDAPSRADRSIVGCAARGVWPLLDGLGGQRGMAVVLGTLAQAWLSRGPARPPTSPGAASPSATRPLARRHPGAALLVAGVAGCAVLWWIRSTARPPP